MCVSVYVCVRVCVCAQLASHVRAAACTAT